MILGNGELDIYLKFYAKKLNLENDIYFLGHKENVFKYYKKSICFVLTSRWEDPGFVLIEAAINNLPILSSDCPNGPREFIKDEKNGYSYPNENGAMFQKKLIEFLHDIESKKILKKKISAKKFTRKFTIFSHYSKLKKILI